MNWNWIRDRYGRRGRQLDRIEASVNRIEALLTNTDAATLRKLQADLKRSNDSLQGAIDANTTQEKKT